MARFHAGAMLDSLRADKGDRLVGMLMWRLTRFYAGATFDSLRADEGDRPVVRLFGEWLAVGLTQCLAHYMPMKAFDLLSGCCGG